MLGTYEDVIWMVEDAIYATPMIESEELGLPRRVVVTDAGRTLAYVVAIDQKTGDGQTIITFNGEWVELSDTMPQFLGLIDAAYELGVGEHYMEADYAE